MMIVIIIETIRSTINPLRLEENVFLNTSMHKRERWRGEGERGSKKRKRKKKIRIGNSSPLTDN